MEFIKAIEKMEQGHIIKRPIWHGYLFLDVDDNIKHVGKPEDKEEEWQLSTHEKDWELAMDRTLNTDDITAARIESIMDGNSQNIKRLYYLEEIIEGQHKAIKKVFDTVNTEMDETRKSLSVSARLMPVLRDEIKQLARDRDDIKKQHEEIKNIKTALEDITKSIKQPIESLLREVKALKENQKKQEKQEKQAKQELVNSIKKEKKAHKALISK